MTGVLLARPQRRRNVRHTLAPYDDIDSRLEHDIFLCGDSESEEDQLDNDSSDDPVIRLGAATYSESESQVFHNTVSHRGAVVDVGRRAFLMRMTLRLRRNTCGVQAKISGTTCHTARDHTV